MGKFIIDLIGELVEISGNSTVDTILFAVIGFFCTSHGKRYGVAQGDRFCKQME